MTKKVKESLIRTMTNLCEKTDGINLGQGLCINPTPKFLLKSAEEAIKANKNFYTSSRGIIELRKSIAHKLKITNNMIYDAKSEILITHGATGGFSCTIQSLLSPNDEIIIFEPFYGYHKLVCENYGIKINYVTLLAPKFSLSREEILSKITKRTKAILICTPGNPSGKIFTKVELEIIKDIVDKFNLLLITDETYEYILFNNKHISPASIKGLRDKTVSIMSFSKTYNITGWRLGYVVGNKKYIDKINICCDLNYVCPATPFQYALSNMHNIPNSFYDNLKEEYTLKRKIVYQALVECNFKPILPDGAYYILANIERLGYSDSFDAAIEILNKTNVACIPGKAFYDSEIGNKYVRFCFSSELNDLEYAAQRLKKIYKGEI